MTDFTDEPKPDNSAAPGPRPPAIVSIAGRRRVMWLFAVPAIAAFAAAFLVWKFPDANVWDIPEAPFFIVCLAVILAGVAAIFVTWRCPVCGSYLGRDPYLPSCAKCGVFFED
jgi:hypothetical protein